MSVVEKEIKDQIKEIPLVFEYISKNIEKIVPKFLEKSELVYFIGCGTSYYLALSASRFFTYKTGIETKALPGGEVTFKHFENVGRNNLNRTAVLISRSGESTEVVKAGEILNELNIKTFGITLEENSSLVKTSSESLILPIKENAIVMTKSFSSMLLSLQIISSFIAGERDFKVYEKVIENVERIIKDSEKLIHERDLLNGSHYVFLGLGMQEGLARESALKLEEMSLTKTEAYSKFEYRHGPKSLVEKGVNIIIFSEKDKEEDKLVEELKNYGGNVIKIGDENSDLYISNDFPYDLSLRIIFSQILGLHIAERKGLDVDRPRNLTKVVSI